MPRKLLDERSPQLQGFSAPEYVWRRRVLSDTLSRLDSDEKRNAAHLQAKANHQRWLASSSAPPTSKASSPRVRVVSGDWGDVALASSQRSGVIYAVLNMANAYLPGGCYLEGTAAQEENMFRRTDCHFHIKDEDIEPNPRGGEQYKKPLTSLINAEGDEVYLDTANPRVCIKKGESDSKKQDGYENLSEDDYFEFYELRSAADDMKKSQKPFNEERARKKISAQLQTLIKNNIKHVVLSAFGCGAFKNPPDVIARLYREEIEKVADQFDDVVFAIYNPGYGPDNLPVFQKELEGMTLGPKALQERAFITALKDEVNQSKWNQKGQSFIFFCFTKVPTGIAKLRMVLNDNTTSTTEKLARVKEIAAERIKNPPLFTRRDAEVLALYNRISAFTLKGVAAPVEGAAASPGTPKA